VTRDKLELMGSRAYLSVKRIQIFTRLVGRGLKGHGI
jgi:hypothetical protein